MSLAPLLDGRAPPIPAFTRFAAMAAFALGLVQFAAPKGDLAAPDVGVDLGRSDGRWLRSPRSGSTRFALVGPWRPDPPVVDLHADHAAARGLVGRTTHQVGRASPRDDRAVLRRACHRRPVHAAAGAHHARRCFLAISAGPIKGTDRRSEVSVKSLEKRRENPVPVDG